MTWITWSGLSCLVADPADIVRAKFDFDVVGHFARPDVPHLTVQDQVLTPVTFTSHSTSQSHDIDKEAADM
jgi:hypothetical protein